MTINTPDAVQLLRRLRWPNGPTCPTCGAPRPLAARPTYRQHLTYHRCRHCHRHFSELTATVFESSKLSLSTWFYLISTPPGAKTFRALSNELGFSRQAVSRAFHTAQRDPLCQRIAASLADSNPKIGSPLANNIPRAVNFSSGTFHRSSRSYQ